MPPHKRRRQGELPERLAAILEVERSPSPAAKARRALQSPLPASLHEQAVCHMRRGRSEEAP